MSDWRIRPSAAARIVSCPGSVRVSAGAPSWIDEYNDPTIREQGTACHEFASYKLLTGCAVEVGRLASNGVACDTGMLDAIHLYETTLRGFKAQNCWIEHALVISALDGCGGTPDYFGWQYQENGRILVDVADLKYGFRIVPTWPNFQLVPYAIGVCEFLGLDPLQVDFRLTIVQPRRWHPAGPVRSARVTGEKLMEQFKVLQHAVNLSNSSIAPLNPGDHCSYCPGRARCSANRDAITNVGFDTANDLPFEDAEKELKFLLEHKAILESRITGLSAQVEHGMRNGTRSKLFELQSTSGRIEWKPESFWQARALAQCMKVDITKVPELITPTQAKRLLGDDFVNTFSHRVQGSKKLVLADPSTWVKRFES